MLSLDWVVVGYVGFHKHVIRLDGNEYFSRDSAIKAASRIMLYTDGMDVEEDYGLALITDIYLER